MTGTEAVRRGSNANGRGQLRDRANEPRVVTDAGVARMALEGLSGTPKTLPPQLFYDDEGCRLFYEITALPEYYLTRTEWSLLPTVVASLGGIMPADSVLVEYGASHEAKASELLRATTASGDPVFGAYVPIDVATTALSEMEQRLRLRFPKLRTYPVSGDFEHPVTLPPALEGRSKLGFFPGSTIGNLDPGAASRFLRLVRSQLGSGAHFLLGADLRKSPSVLIPAYDDAAGVTAAFNRNLLVRLNREAAAGFDPTSFTHRAVWNDAEGRIEMHLVSRQNQMVQVAGQAVHFREGESIHTENSYKFSPSDLAELADGAGWSLVNTWFDDERRFGVFLFKTG